jgi:polyether ionophore transport system permease protein
MTAVRFALRLGRWGIVGFGLLGFASSFAVTLAFYNTAGQTEAERAAFGRSITVLASQFSVILPPPIRPDTVEGFVQFRSFGGLVILFAVWALASASGATRGDEERGVVEVVLAASLTRLAMVASRITAFAAGSFIAALAAGVGLAIGVTVGGETIDVRRVLEAAIELSAVSLSCYSLTLLVAQLAGARLATAAAGILLLVLFLINSLSRTFASLETWRWVSPFHYYELSQPLPVGGTFDVRATLTLLAIAVVAGIAAAAAFAFRDLGSPLVRIAPRPHPVSYEASHSPLWRIPVVRGLYDRRAGLALWAAGVAVLGAVFVAVTKSAVAPLLSIPQVAIYLRALVHGGIYPSFLGYIWFGAAQLLFAAFAITQVARWCAEDADGRLELILSNPESRWAIVIERAAVLAIGAFFVAAVSATAVGLASHNQAIDVDTTRLAAASLELVPLAMVFGAAGSVLAAWKPRAALGLLGGIAFASYLITELGPFLQLPAWIQDVSAFTLFGSPLAAGIDSSGLTIMLSIVVIGFAASILVLQRRDVGA